MFPPIDPNNPGPVSAPDTKPEPVKVSPPTAWKMIATEAIVVFATAEIALWVLATGINFYSA